MVRRAAQHRHDLRQRPAHRRCQYQQRTTLRAVQCRVGARGLAARRSEADDRALRYRQSPGHRLPAQKRHRHRCLCPAIRTAPRVLSRTVEEVLVKAFEAGGRHAIVISERAEISPNRPASTGLGAPMKGLLIVGVTLIALAGSVKADDVSMPLPLKAASAPVSSGYDWTGFYAGGHLGAAWGSSNWTGSTIGAPASTVSGSFNLYRPIDSFSETGSFFEGLDAGYNYMFANRFVIGGEVDASFPSFPDVAGISIGGTSTFVAPSIGAESYSETMLSFGTVRGRIGYAPGNWLFYATGGLALTYDRLALTPPAGGTSEAAYLWRFGWAAGVGAEVPIAPHWTARLEYLFTDYGIGSVGFPGAGQRFSSDFSLQELRAGVNYRFGDDGPPARIVTKAPATPDLDTVNFHGQSTFVEQAYPAIRSPYQGVNSLPAGGEGRETFDVTLYAGVRLWQGAELWIDPEIDQGFGLGTTHGVAGFTSAEAYKLGSEYAYARVQRYFVRQTIDLG